MLVLLYIKCKIYTFLDIAIIADQLDGLSKETSLAAFPTPKNTTKTDNSDVSKILQQTSEGLVHLSVQWPNYAKSYDTTVLEVLKLIQVCNLKIMKIYYLKLEDYNF